MKYSLKAISLIVAGVIIAATAIFYFCPMAAASGSCASPIVTGRGLVGAASCVSTHLIVVGKLLNIVLPAVDLFLLAVFLAAARFGASRRYFLAAAIRPLLDRLRRLRWNYDAVKRLIGQKLFAYLEAIGNYAVVSLS